MELTDQYKLIHLKKLKIAQLMKLYAASMQTEEQFWDELAKAPSPVAVSFKAVAFLKRKPCNQKRRSSFRCRKISTIIQSRPFFFCRM
ncbi:hypothetical protein D770_03925 [Flammeovirgaceae bacterium 311]|nr:hypothetical protein D770_03925 [Flammeovirgaceae bacterium 311]